MKRDEGRARAVEDIERGAGARIDLEQQRAPAFHHEIG